jgi:hypothetical protein
MRNQIGAPERIAPRAKNRYCEHREVNDAVENVRGVIDQLKRFLNSGADLAGDGDDQRVVAPTKMMELIGVLYRGCRRENQFGSNRSQPATIGNRELPVT